VQNLDLFIIILVMAGLNILQFIYWSRIVSDLTLKLMSKNVGEYKQAVSPVIVQERDLKVDVDDALEEESILNQLNSMVR
jgi:hypothetical protein